VGSFVGLFWTVWTASFHTCVDRTEVVFGQPLFTPVLTGVRLYSFAVLASI
jgi:hypothetical protein